MIPKIGEFYQMRASYIEQIKDKNFRVMPHVYVCGNKFQFVSHKRSLMRCVTCGHTYKASVDLFTDIYEPIGGANPNILFKRRHL